MSDPIVTKLAKAMKDVSWVAKSAKNQRQGYSYTPASEIYAHIRPLLAAQGIVIVPKMTELEQNEAGKTSNGTPIIHSKATFEMLITDGESSLAVPWASEASDMSDKGINKCATAAMKYFLQTLMLISTGEDADGESPQATEGSARGAEAPSQRRATSEKRPPPAQAGPEMITPAQITALAIAVKEAGFDSGRKAQGRDFMAFIAGLDHLDSAKDLTKQQGMVVLDALGADDLKPTDKYRTDKIKVEHTVAAWVEARAEADFPPEPPEDMFDGPPPEAKPRPRPGRREQTEATA